MQNTISIFFLILILTSCKNHVERLQSQEMFTTRKVQLKSELPVSAIAFSNDLLICLQENGKLLLLDSNYNRQDSLEKKLDGYKSEYLFTLHDTVFIVTKNKTFFFDKNFELIEFRKKGRYYGDYLYEDSSYYVYGCCMGEFGGSVYFLNKKTNRTYSYFATCATQVLRFQNEYVVCNNLAHMGPHMSYLFIPEPLNLYELTNENDKNNCNWYVTVDSLKNHREKPPIGGVRFYENSYGLMSLVSFSYRDSLYSIISSDSTTYIAVHRDDTTLQRQVILEETISFHWSQVIAAGGKLICLYRLTEGSPFAAYTTTGNRSGLLIVNNNQINIVDKF